MVHLAWDGRGEAFEPGAGDGRCNRRSLSILLGVLLSCCHSGAPSKATSPSSSTTKAGPAVVSVPAAPAKSAARAPRPSLPVSGGRDVYGYLGKRGVIGKVAVDGPRWAGAFFFVDSKQAISIEGTAKPPEQDPDAPPDDSAMTGRKQHAYLDCSFTATGQGETIDASCLDEEGTLEVDGQWVSGRRYESFFLRTPGKSALDAQELYSALLSTPTPSHACAPFAELLSREERAERAVISYKLRWPCDEQRPDQTMGGVLGTGARPSPPPSHQAYVADVSLSEPPRMSWSSAWTSLPDPDESDEVTLGFSVLEFAPGLELYVAAESDDFRSPTTGGGNSSHQLTVWAVSTDNHGPKLDLPAESAGHEGWCFAHNVSNESWLLDLDGDKVSEIVIRVTSNDRHDAMGKNGQVTCVDDPATVKFLAYRLSRSTLVWEAMRAPTGLTEQRLKRGTPLSL